MLGDLPEDFDRLPIEMQQDALRLRASCLAYLAHPKPRRVTIADHGPWDFRAECCLSCGQSKRRLYSTILMPPCQREA